MQRRVVQLMIMAAIAAGGFTVVMTSPASAHHCGGSGGIFDGGGEVSAECHGNVPGSPPSSSSDSDFYESWCGVAPGPDDTVNEDGANFNVVFLRELEEADLIARGLPLTGRYALYRIDCGTPLTGGTAVFTLDPPEDPEVLRDRAAARIVLPEPSLGSNPDFAETFAVVNLETWLWVTDPWQSLTESETEGFVTVEVFAEPRSVTWDFAAGGSAVCTGPGIEWSPAAHDAGTYCAHTFTSSSADQPDAAYASTATTAWVFTWAINGVDQGEFGTTTASTGFSIQVGEIQAVEVNN